MYEQRFGLNHNPFRIAAAGQNVFVGPQQAKIISALQRSLERRDNIVSVSGLVGAGKTTIVARALETNNRLQVAARIGRMRLAPDELLQLLLGGFGVSRLPAGTVQRIAMFKQVLNEYAAADKRVIIVIEDALRIGNDSLLELEALTASDGGAACGANIILMGPPEIDKRLTFPELARLKQRARKPLCIQPFTVAEVRGYLKHCMRAAGASYEKLFEEGSETVLHRCSEGIPRMINNICDEVFAAAAKNRFDRITPQLILEIAEDHFGIEPMPVEPPSLIDEKHPAAIQDRLIDVDPKPEIQNASNATPEPEPELKPAPDVMSETAESERSNSFLLPPVVAAALAQEREEKAPEPPDFDSGSPEQEALASDAETHLNIPDVFKPEPEIESEIAAFPLTSPDSRAAIEDEEAIETAASKAFDNLPTLSNSMRIERPTGTEPLPPEIEASEGAVEATGERPTPDLDALEAAINAAHSAAPTSGEEDLELPDLSSGESVTGDTSAELPRLNLQDFESEHEPSATTEPEIEMEMEMDPALEPDPVPPLQGLTEDAPEAESVELSTLEITLDKTLEYQRSESQKLDDMAVELGSVSSLEDMNDLTAETLFGTEFEQIAAEALANPPAAGTLPGDTDAVDAPAVASSLPANDPIAESSPVMLESNPVSAMQPAPPESLESSTVEAPATPPATETAVATPAAPESIEDQFQTSITQTLKALDLARMAEEKIDPDDDEDEKPAGFFGRFRKSLKS